MLAACLDSRGPARLAQPARASAVASTTIGAINDLRIAAELTGSLQFFYAAWELPGLGWSEAIIPDGLFAFERNNVALEFDTGTEAGKSFMRKMTV